MTRRAAVCALLACALGAAPVSAQGTREIVIGQGQFAGAGGWVAYRGALPQYESRGWSQLPWSDYIAMGGAVHPAMGDVDGDGRDELVLGVDTGGFGWIAVLDDRAHGSTVLAWLQIPWPAYNATNGAVFPAVGDVDGDGRAEIVAGLGAGSAGQFVIFDDAAAGYAVRKWQQVQWPAYSGGGDGRTHVAVGDLSGDGASEIVVGLGPGSNGWLEIFSDATGDFRHRAWVQVSWPTYNAVNGTVYPAAGDLDGDGRAEIVAGLGTGGYGWLELLDDERAGFRHRSWVQLLWPEYNAAAGETHPAVGNLDADAAAEIVVGLAPHPGNGGWFEIFDDLGAGARHLAWRNVEWSTFRAAGGATYPAAAQRHPATIVSPSGGEQWIAGSARDLTWVADATLENVRLEYSLDNGATWETIGSAAAASGRYGWTVPNVASRFVQVRVVDPADGRAISPVRTFVVLRDTSALWQLVTPSAAWNPRDGVGAFVFNGRMWQLGGWHPDPVTYPNTYVEIWSSADGEHWRDDGWGPWSGTHACGCVVFNNRMWIVGGNGYPDVWVSDNGVAWTRLLAAGPWGRRYKAYVVAHAGRIWLMGGYDYLSFVPFNDVWSTTDGVTWTRVLEHAPWAGRGAIHGTAVFDGKIWILGGGQYPHGSTTGERYFNDVWSSADGVSWTLVNGQPPWRPRLHHNVAVYADRLWVMDGHDSVDGRVNLLNDVWVSQDGVNWMELKGTPWSRRHAAATYAHDGTLFFTAGYLVNDVWKLHLAGNIEINDGDATTASAAVTLALAPPDPAVDAMQFSNDGVTWSAPEAYARTRNWTLSAGAGAKSVHVRFRRSGVWTRSYADAIVLNGP